MGINDVLGECKSLIKSKVKRLDKNDYPQTYEIYSLFTQLISQCENPSGSLMSFNNKINDINILR